MTKKQQYTRCDTAQNHQAFRKKALAVALASATLSVSSVYAQDIGAPAGIQEEELIVTGTIRDTIRNSIELKREASTIVDAISASDIGATPDLSVAETLERITGVTADRFKGNASEISIRGLGPFLGTSTYNGREVSSGSGNRSVAFSQFPSELVSKAVVYKGQQADIQEGGVAGLINLGSIRPIDFGKTRFRAEVKGSYSDYASKIEGESGIGNRISVSYTDVFDTSSGTWGLALGYAGSDTQTPEEDYLSSSTYRACNQDRAVPTPGGSGNCEGGDRRPGPITDGEYYYTTNQRLYRTMDTTESRDAAMLTVQWQPNDEVDITWDSQISNRFYDEDRHDLNIEEGRRNIANPVIFQSRALSSFTGESRIATNGEFRERDEDYFGSGLNIKWNATDALEIEADLSISDTHREQFYTQTRLRTNSRYWYDWQANIDDWAEITEFRTELSPTDPDSTVLTQAELNDLTIYSNGSGRRTRFEQFEIDDTIRAFRLEGDYALDTGFITSIKGGVRVSRHDHDNFYRDRRDINARATELTDTIADQCAIPFINKDYGEDATFGESAFTTWAQYDTLCAARLIVDSAIVEGRAGDDTSYDQIVAGIQSRDPASNDVLIVEDVQSAFVMASFESELGIMPVSGNVGIRVVRNTTTSTGYSERFRLVETVDPDDGSLTYDAQGTGEITSVTEFENTYTNVLPSLNVNLGLNDTVDLRVSAYRAVSRPDMWWLGAGRSISTDDDADGASNTSPEAAAAALVLSGTGNNKAEAIESDNFDISVGWYPNEDTAISVALYHKQFNAGFGVLENVRETIDVDVVQGGSVTGTLQVDAPVRGIIDIVDEESDLSGVEVTVQHGFTYLPEPFDGFGFALGYNYADTDFETPEGSNDIVSPTSGTPEVLADLEPGSLPSFSEESYNGQIYWENYGWSVRLAYKYRSEYLKPFGGTLNQTNRFVRPTDDLSFSLSYKITDDLTAKFQALNLTNSAYLEERTVDQAINRAEYNGVKYFLGLTLKI